MALRYVCCLRWLMEIPNKPAAALLLYGVLRHDARFPPRELKSLQKYADETGLSVRTMRRARAWLRKHRIIDVKPWPASNSPPEYVVYEPPVHQAKMSGWTLAKWQGVGGQSVRVDPDNLPRSTVPKCEGLFPSEVLEVKEEVEAPELSPLSFAFKKQTWAIYGKRLSERELWFFNPLFVAGVPLALAVDEMEKGRLGDAPWEHVKKIEKGWDDFKAQMVQLRQFYVHGIGSPPSSALLAQMERYLRADGIAWAKGEEPHTDDPEPPGAS